MTSPYLIIFPGFLIIIFLVLYKHIMSFLFPEDWISILILKKHKQVKFDLVSIKNKTDKFTYQKNEYYIINYTPYKKGRLNFFTYREGEKQPIDLLKNTKLDDELDKQLRELNIIDIFTTSGKLKDIVKDYGMLALIVIGVIALFLMFAKDKGVPIT